jgi:ABC-type uncharacterized transport system permease subunit
MIIALQAIQIGRYWDIIKKAALESDNISLEHSQEYAVELLSDLLSGKKVAILGTPSEAVQSMNNQVEGVPIAFVLIARLGINSETGKKSVHFTNLYGFQTLPMSEYEKVPAFLYAFAKRLGCDEIWANAVNPRVQEFIMKQGALYYTTQYYWKI